MAKKKAKFKMPKRKAGRPYKQIHINVKEFIDMVRFIREHPVDRIIGNHPQDAPIPETGRAYWHQAMDQVIECLAYIQEATPMTSARKVFHDKKISRYSDDRLEIYEYVRTEIIEKNGGSSKLYEK